MHWRENGLLLSANSHAETSVIADVFTRSRGRFLGLVRGGRSKAMRPLLQPGNRVDASWRARLEEHLGNLTLEPVEFKLAVIFDDAFKLAGLVTLTSLLKLLPERDPHPGLYDAAMLVLDALDDDEVWPTLLVRTEMALLEELGFGLDLQQCAATGQTQELIYVSPKSGRAVSRLAGHPYHDKLLPLPAFLSGGLPPSDRQEILNAYRLTGYFLDRDVYHPRNMGAPEERNRIIRHLSMGQI